MVPASVESTSPAFDPLSQVGDISLREVVWGCPGARWAVARIDAGSGWSAPAELQPQALRAAGLATFRLPALPLGFQNFAGFAALLNSLLPVVDKEAPAIRRAHERSLALVAAYCRDDGAPSPAAGAVADSTLFAITRRLSRESHESALVIDDLARFVLEAHRMCPSLEHGVAWAIDDLENWDRPSLRCLHRVVDISQPSDKIVFVGLLDGGSVLEQPQTLAERIAWSRARFFERLESTDNFEIVGGAPGFCQEVPPVPQLGEGASMATLVLEVELALGYQNYERVYALCEALLARAASVGDDRSQAHRLLGITHAQLEDFASAEQEFQQGAVTAASSTLRAHHYYLLGLLSTKRRYNLNEAASYYDRGRKALDEAGDDGPDVRLERGWLLNGQALVETLRAKALGAGEERDRLIQGSLELELAAYRLVKEDGGPHASYLRHNLLANITFLFEIAKRPQDAVAFWRRAFEKYLAVDSPAFVVGFSNRLGMLLFKAGDVKTAASVLDEAQQMAQRGQDRFYGERTYFAQGYVAYRSGEHAKALQAFSEGASLASELRENRSLRDHVSGMCWCLAEVERGPELKRLLRSAVAMLPLAGSAQQALDLLKGGAAKDALVGAGLELRVPSPKLSSYVPNVDLEGEGRRDLNRYLVAEARP